jgi:hypothetical protein
MMFKYKRRALVIGVLLSPATWASSRFSLVHENRPVDLIRRLMDEVLTSSEQRNVETESLQKKRIVRSVGV